MMGKQTMLGGLAMLFLSFALAGCTVPQNELPLLQRSVVIDSEEERDRILAKASVKEVSAPDATPVRIVHVSGTPYEMGFQHGILLRDDIQKMYGKLIRRVKFYLEEDMLDEVYDLMAPYIPTEEQQEMRGLAHGADVPLRVVHWVHIIPALSEYGPKDRFRKGFDPTSCSNLVAFGKATRDGELYQVRVLDWVRDFGIQQWPILLVHHPDEGHASVTSSYAGFIGAVTGMNDQRMAFGEMGYGDPPAETLRGIPFVFLFRKMMREADSLEDAEKMIRTARRTSSYVYVIGDAGKPEGETNALLFITDRDRVLTFEENTHLVDEREDGDNYPPIDDVVYGGAKSEVLYDAIKEQYGRLDPETLMRMTKPVSLDSNLHNVIFRPAAFEMWVSNASMEDGEAGKASNQGWIHVDFNDELRQEATAAGDRASKSATSEREGGS